MNKLVVLSIFMGLAQAGLAMDVQFEGNQKKVISITADKSTGLENIFVAYDCSNISQMFISGFTSNSVVSKYGNLGGGFADHVKSDYIEGKIIVEHPTGNTGYIIEDEGRNYCFWLVDYKPYELQLSSITPVSPQECDNTQINVNGIGGAIHYFTIDGRQAELSRQINVEYNNLRWNSDTEQYEQFTANKELSHLSNPVILNPPLYCNSIVSISGDRFLQEWNMIKRVESNLLPANGVAAETTATQNNEGESETEASNMIKTETQGMGGSAPADISFNAYVTDAVIHNEWQIASDPDFEYIEYRFNEQNLDYTFTEEGNFYVRFIGSNSDGSCEAIGETYEVSIGASDLRIPNAFTPNDDGVNDVWKVGYRSLLSFKCSIFDRYGNELHSFSDPAQGWDGKYKGKLVKPGVYFYVIEAIGADGKKYKKGGDINILRSKRNNSQEN